MLSRTSFLKQQFRFLIKNFFLLFLFVFPSSLCLSMSSSSSSSFLFRFLPGPKTVERISPRLPDPRRHRRLNPSRGSRTGRTGSCRNRNGRTEPNPLRETEGNFFSGESASDRRSRRGSPFGFLFSPRRHELRRRRRLRRRRSESLFSNFLSEGESCRRRYFDGDDKSIKLKIFLNEKQHRHNLM